MEFVLERALCGWFVEPVFWAFLKRSSAEDQNNSQDFLKKWGSATKKTALLAVEEKSVADSVATWEVEDRFSERINVLASQPAFRNEFRNQNFEFKLVEIDKLATISLTVFWDYVKHLISKYPKNPTPEQVFDICLALTREHSEIKEIKLDPFNSIFYAPGQDIRLIEVISRNIENLVQPESVKGIPVMAFATRIGMGLPVVNAVSIGKRLLLRNGHHRLLALRLLGVTRVPAVVLSGESEDIVDEKTRQFISEQRRPPLLKDYLDSELTMTARSCFTKKGIKVSVSAQEIALPSDFQY